MVLGRGFEPRSPALQAGAFTRLAFRAVEHCQPFFAKASKGILLRADEDEGSCEAPLARSRMVRPARIELASSEGHSEALPLDQGRMVESGWNRTSCPKGTAFTAQRRHQ